MHVKAINVVSSLPLQKLLYFNFFYAFVFAVAHVAMCVFKIVYMPSNLTTRIVLPILVSLWALVEIARLRLGYNGNLHEKVPELSAFWLLTVLPQAPLVIYLSFAQPMDRIPLDTAVGIFMIIFLALELPYSFAAVRNFIRKQTADFYRLCLEEAALLDGRSGNGSGSGVGSGAPRSGRAADREGRLAGAAPPLSDATLSQAIAAHAGVAAVAKEGLGAIAGIVTGATGPAPAVSATAAAAGTGLAQAAALPVPAALATPADNKRSE